MASMERRLLPFDGVVASWEQLVAAFRARVLAIPSRMAARLVAMNERGVIQSVLTAEVREALTELSRYELPDNPRGEPPASANPT